MDVYDIAGFASLALVVVGAFLIFIPAGFIVAGLLGAYFTLRLAPDPDTNS